MNFERTQTSSQGFTGDSEVKNLPANAGEAEDSGSTPEMGRSLKKGNSKHILLYGHHAK